MMKNTDERARQDALYANKPWAALAIKAGFRPYDTESAARSAFEYAAEALAASDAELAAVKAERDALREVDRLAGIASRFHWFGGGAVGEYEDSDDLFQDLDNARAALTERQP